jgi:IS30 family transposase
MGKKYQQLTIDQRYQIAALIEEGKTQKEIAAKVKVVKSTISREIKRNSSLKGYVADTANKKAIKRKKEARKRVKFDTHLESLVKEKLLLKWSPEQISGVLKKEKSIYISPERIYQFIWNDKRNGGELYKNLRSCNKKYKKRSSLKDMRGQIKNKISIDERPSVVEEKSRIGDWEIDTVVGANHKGYLITAVERFTKYTIIRKVNEKSAEVVAQSLIEAFFPLQLPVLTITADNGKEFAYHETISKELNCGFYFAHPYSSWERGLNENTNGLIRQYIPKKERIDTIPDSFILQIEKELNSRPRKGLGYSSPQEIINRREHASF